MSDDMGLVSELTFMCPCAPHCTDPEACDMCSKEVCVYCKSAKVIERLTAEVARLQAQFNVETAAQILKVTQLRAERAEAEAARLREALKNACDMLDGVHVDGDCDEWTAMWNKHIAANKAALRGEEG